MDKGTQKPATGLRLITGYISYALILTGVIVMFPLIMVALTPKEEWLVPCFVLPGIGSIALGCLLFVFTLRGRERGRLKKNEDLAMMCATWVVAVVVCCLPFILSDMCSVPQAVFEAMSGLTTTGMSIINVRKCPTSMLLHRSMMHFFGGVGLILIMVTLVRDGGILRIYRAEGHTDKLFPDMTTSARYILALYTGYIAAGILAYVVAGMPLFDAVNMSISAVSTGGFAVRAASIGAYHSAAIEIISVILMLLGGTNFLLSYLLVRGEFKRFVTHCETKALAGIVIVASLAVFIILLDSFPPGTSPAGAFLLSVFHVVSVVTTTGFQTISSFKTLPSGVTLVLVILMFIGAQAGSTTGALKVYRVVVACKGVYWSLRQRYGRHRSVYSYRINRFGMRQQCTPEEVWDTYAFVVLYVLLFFIGSLIFAVAGLSVEDATFEFASCLGNVGVSCGAITADASPVILWTGTVGMFLGRLEIIPVFLGVRRLAVLTKQALAS